MSARENPVSSDDVVRHKTLEWVARMTLDSEIEHINLYTKEFVDALSHPRNQDVHAQMAMVGQEPALLGEPWANALLAGLAEMVARRADAEPPQWTEDPQRFLPCPVFFGYTPQTRSLMLAETPGPMRRRNLFCGHIELTSYRWKDGQHGA